jgi:hypothetical protein
VATAIVDVLCQQCRDGAVLPGQELHQMIEEGLS